jgi:bud emergence protein 1
MNLIKALRRSIKGEKENKPHISIAPKSAVAIVPPKKVRPKLSVSSLPAGTDPARERGF